MRERDIRQTLFCVYLLCRGATSAEEKRMKTYSRKNSSYLRKAFIGSNFDEMCRLCLSEVDLSLKPIFQEMGKISYQERIRYTVDVLVEEGDNLPSNICEECLLMVEQIYLFKKKCKASDAKLREHLELLELDEEGKFNETGLDFIQDKNAFSKEETIESNCDKSSAIDSGGTDGPHTDQPEKTQPDIIIDATIPDQIEETQLQEKVQVKRYIIKGEINEDNQEEDLTVCEVVPLEDKTYTTLESVSENELSETSQENRIQEIYKLWDNEEETEPEQVSSMEDEGEIVLDAEEDNADKNDNAGGNNIIEMQAVYTNDNEMVIMQTISDAIKYKCFACHKMFEKSSELAEHLAKIHHNVANPVFCKTCGKSFTCPNSLKRHMTVHTGLRPYQCHICNRKFSQGSILKRHELTHNALKPFNCEICGKSYTQKMNLLTHLKNHGFGTTQDRFRCTICSKSFVHQSGLSRHTKMHQGVRYLCVKCQKSFVDSSALARHMKSHTSPG